jgi:hypothetical protein
MKLSTLHSAQPRRPPSLNVQGLLISSAEIRPNQEVSKPGRAKSRTVEIVPEPGGLGSERVPPGPARILESDVGLTPEPSHLVGRVSVTPVPFLAGGRPSHGSHPTVEDRYMLLYGSIGRACKQMVQGASVWHCNTMQKGALRHST